MVLYYKEFLQIIILSMLHFEITECCVTTNENDENRAENIGQFSRLGNLGLF